MVRPSSSSTWNDQVCDDEAPDGKSHRRHSNQLARHQLADPHEQGQAEKRSEVS